jgi:murein DD-endopeptidase MepM/ murein hydrolase activator NlpD
MNAHLRYGAIGFSLATLCAVAFVIAANTAVRSLRQSLAMPPQYGIEQAGHAATIRDTPAAASNPNASANADANATAVSQTILQELRARALTVPVAGAKREQLSSTSFHEGRPDHPHEALDIMAPRGTPVVAVEDGTIEKLFWSRFGGHTIYQFDPSRRFAYYYAHLDRYADGLTEGRIIHRGDTLGFVGSTGNASPTAPHLHFAIFLLTPERHWWKGTAIDPYPVLSEK